MEKVILGDCLDILPTIEENSIDLIYLDPPFFTNKIQKLKTRMVKKSFHIVIFGKVMKNIQNFYLID